jgi:hypothetical protein
MSRPCCCRKRIIENPSRRASRWLDAVGWLVPAAALAMMPKCPICLAAYVALFTGLGVSLPVAAAVRTALIVACVASLGFMAWRTALRAMRSRKPRPIPVGA